MAERCTTSGSNYVTHHEKGGEARHDEQGRRMVDLRRRQADQDTAGERGSGLKWVQSMCMRRSRPDPDRSPCVEVQLDAQDGWRASSTNQLSHHRSFDQRKHHPTMALLN